MKVRISSHLYSFAFNEKEVNQFIQLADQLDKGSSLKAAITQAFGNQQQDALKARNNRIKQLTISVAAQEKSIQFLQSQLIALNQQVSCLTDRVNLLENKKWFKPRQN